MDPLVERAEPLIKHVFDEVRDLVVEKNRSYGGSMLKPGLFGPKDPEERIWCRISDKLARLQAGNSYPGDNDLKDLMGYFAGILVLRAISNTDKEDTKNVGN